MPRVTAAHCRVDSPLMCVGRAAAPSPGVWLDPDRFVWLWSDGTGIVEVSHCPFCLHPLPRVGATILRRLETLGNPEE